MPATSLPRPATLPRRCGAMLYDGMVVVALWMLTLFIGVAITDGAVLGPSVQTILFFELFGFFAFFWVSRGQTVGMLAWGLHLESRDGHRIRPNQALLRFIGALLAFASCGIGYLWMYVDPDGRTWPDMLSATHLIYRPPE